MIDCKRFAVVLCLLVGAAHAADPEEIAVDQAALAARYERLESLALRIAELAEADDPERAQQLRGVIRASREMAVADRFATIVELLESERLAAAGRDQQALADQLGRLMRLLLADPREAKAEAERKRLEALLKDIRRFIKRQQALRDALFDGESPERVAGRQAELAEGVEQALRRADTGNKATKPTNGAGKLSPGSPQQGPSSAGEKGDSSQEDPSQGGGQPGEPGAPSENNPSDAQRPPPKKRAQQRLAEARRAMQKAIERLREAQADGAKSNQAEAQQRLEEARREIEQALRQLREEEQVRMLTRLATRFRRMLAEQTEVYEATKQAAARAPKPPDRAARLAAGGLAQREEALVLLADGALRLLRDDGQSIAFPQTVVQVRSDMRQVADWLRGTRLGLGTQRLEQDIIEQLETAIAAFEQAAAEKQEQQQQQQKGNPQSGQQADPQLVELLAELRMIRSLQSRLLRRTLLWDQLVAEGDATAIEARAALLKLAEDQQRLGKAAESLAKTLDNR